MKQLKSERVLLENGQFAPFPKRLEERAVATGAIDAKPDNGEEDPSVPRKDQAQSELDAKQSQAEKNQKAHDKRQPETAYDVLKDQPTGGEKVEDPQIPRQNKAQAELAAKKQKRLTKAQKEAMKDAAGALADIVPENE